MSGVAKKKPESKTKKPEVMEQNQDALDYFREEEKEGLGYLNGKLKEKGEKRPCKDRSFWGRVPSIQKRFLL